MKIAFLIMTAVLFPTFAKAGLVDQYIGRYYGKIDKRVGTLIIEKSGNSFAISFKGDDGTTDILGENCKSMLGQMVHLDIDNKENKLQIDSADFAFSPGNCADRSKAKTLYVDFKHKDGKLVGLRASILIGSREVPGNCTNAEGRDYCSPLTTQYEFMSGQFFRN